MRGQHETGAVVVLFAWGCDYDDGSWLRNRTFCDFRGRNHVGHCPVAVAATLSRTFLAAQFRWAGTAACYSGARRRHRRRAIRLGEPGRKRTGRVASLPVLSAAGCESTGEVWWPTEVRLSIRTTNAFWPAFEALLTHEEDYRRGKRAKLKGEMVLVAHWREPVDSTVVEVWMDGYQVGEMTRHFSNQYYQPITKIGGAIVVKGWISAEAPDRYTKSGHRGGFRLCRPELIEKPASALAYGTQTLPFGGKVPIVVGESFAPAVAEILGKRERRLAYLTLRLAMSEADGYKARIDVFFGEHQVGYLSEADSSALLHRVQAIEANGLIAAARGSFIQGEEGTRGYLHVKRTSRAKR